MAVTGFNPRARVGRDLFAGDIFFQPCAFQSTRPRGARLKDQLNHDEVMTFQSTRPRGARHLAGSIGGIAESVSIHAPAWGATHQIAS